MTTMHIEPRMTVVDGEIEAELPVPVPSSRIVFEAGEFEYRAIATVRLALTRDHLAAAADLSAQNDGYINPDMWSEDYTRHLVEQSLAHERALILDEGAVTMAELLDPNGPDVSLLPVVQALYRAIDRAYPPQPPAVSVVDREHRGRFVVCSRCDWTRACGADPEQDVSVGVDHFEREHGDVFRAVDRAYPGVPR